jgi:hypothetical protein
MAMGGNGNKRQHGAIDGNIGKCVLTNGNIRKHTPVDGTNSNKRHTQ